jgi:hypothetical protein
MISGVLSASYCVPGPADATDCSSKPCVTGKICIDKICRPACDGTHPCPGIAKCQTVSYDGKPTQWSACN